MLKKYFRICLNSKIVLYNVLSIEIFENLSYNYSNWDNEDKANPNKCQKMTNPEVHNGRPIEIRGNNGEKLWF